MLFTVEIFRRTGMHRLLPWTCSLVLSLGMIGCAGVRGSRSADAQSALDLQVPTPPPTERSEADHSEGPGFGYIWVAGYWDYLDGNYIWRGGHWLQAQGQFEYVRARYDYD